MSEEKKKKEDKKPLRKMSLEEIKIERDEILHTITGLKKRLVELTGVYNKKALGGDK